MRIPVPRMQMVGLVAGALIAIGGARTLAAQSSSGAPARTDTLPARRARVGYTGLTFNTRVALSPDGKYQAGYSTIGRIEPGSPADSAGFKVGDVILAVNGVDARAPSALFFAPHQRYIVRVRRGSEEREQILIPAERTR